LSTTNADKISAVDIRIPFVHNIGEFQRTLAYGAVAMGAPAATIDGMADARKGDRHRPSRMMRISERMAEILDKLAERNDTSAAAEANRLIREGLERLNLWPPPDPPARTKR
jgi:hypothetical protein